jgi:hypothetical protein
MVSGRESEQELAESHLTLRNAWLCFRVSSSFVGNNPSLQILSFSEDQGNWNKTGNPSLSYSSTFLTSDILILADSSHLPSDEAYRQRLSVPCYRISTPCYKCKLKARHFLDKIFYRRFEIMIQHTTSIICDFHLPVDFRLDILFPHIFWFLHQN